MHPVAPAAGNTSSPLLLWQHEVGGTSEPIGGPKKRGVKRESYSLKGCILYIHIYIRSILYIYTGIYLWLLWILYETVGFRLLACEHAPHEVDSYQFHIYIYNCDYVMYIQSLWVLCFSPCAAVLNVYIIYIVYRCVIVTHLFSKRSAIYLPAAGQSVSHINSPNWFLKRKKVNGINLWGKRICGIWPSN